MGALSVSSRQLVAPLGLALTLALGLLGIPSAVGCGVESGHQWHGEPKLPQSNASTLGFPTPVIPPLSMMDDDDDDDNGIDLVTRARWMRQANLALPDPCPFGAFGAVVVNHTVGGPGELVCTGANGNRVSGNPTLHGEMAAINNCSALFVDPRGSYRMTPAEALNAFADLTIYSNAESCPMCASAIRWAGFGGYVYGTSIDALVDMGWGQIRIGSRRVFELSADLPSRTRLVGPVLSNETDVFFGWQFNPDAPCPRGCFRDRDQGVCRPT
ncbi:FCY1p [Colletotrichum higginsianum]|nr:FCY1p [Colletotrichum higginsianum]